MRGLSYGCRKVSPRPFPKRQLSARSRASTGANGFASVATVFFCSWNTGHAMLPLPWALNPMSAQTGGWCLDMLCWSRPSSLR